MRIGRAVALWCSVGAVLSGVPAAARSIDPVTAQHTSASSRPAAGGEAPGRLSIDEFRSYEAEHPAQRRAPGRASKPSVSGTCDQRELKDRSGDGSIDIVSMKVFSNCATWAFDLETTTTIRPAALDVWFVQFDLDFDNSTGCGGTDRFIAVYGTTDGRLGSEVIDALGCTRDTWSSDNAVPTLHQSGTVVRVAARAFSPGMETGPFRWYVDTHPSDAHGTIDFAPNKQWRVAVVPPWPPTLRFPSVVDGNVMLEWTAPHRTGGSPIRRYLTRWKRVRTRAWTDGPTFRPDRTTGVIRGLELGQSYEIQVAAMNSLGAPAWSRSRVVLVSLPPSAPVGLTATPGDGEVTLTWSKPVSTGGLRLDHYNIQIREGTGEWTRVRRPVHGVTTSRITGLTNGSTYTVEVTAVHARGTSEPASVTFALPPI